MRKTFRNGMIVVTGKNYEDAVYDVCSNDLHVRFDGKGGITDYTVIHRSGNYVERLYFSIFVNGEILSAYCDKTVEMVGRTQKIVLKKGDCRITVLQFVPIVGNAVFYEIKANRTGDYDVILDLSSVAKSYRFASSVENRFISANSSIRLHTDKSARFVLSFDTDDAYCKAMLTRFAEHKKQVTDEIKSVVIPKTAKTEKDKALYVSSVLCALQNYKTIGKYKGFSPSCVCTGPVRSYYVDAYYATLSLYKQNRTDLVRDQIVTLAHGIDESGDCPAAVTFRFEQHWRTHYDTPSFFVITVYDYINRTGDFSILDETANGRTVYRNCLLAIDKLSSYEDETSLIKKPGVYNVRDWTDRVHRTGYVTYDEVLYARALYCLSRIAERRDKTRAAKYHELFLRTKSAINEILWDEEKGYYINYKAGDFVEDNLSADTILAVLFGISDKEKTERLLDGISALLETRNNKLQQAGDFGVMSVYPFYRGFDRCYNKSTQEYEQQNGAAHPALSALVAYAQLQNGRDHTYALTSAFDWNVKRGNYTLPDYYSPCAPEGAPLMAWNGVTALVYDFADEDFFKEDPTVWKKK
ncbi:MAG: hypothetical protein IKX66_04505 [Clostridia bacterium]|nr:hypothetical protein [Clostridia bacterium]